MPQPNLVPVKPRLSRKTQSTGVSGNTSTEWDCPFTLIRNAAIEVLTFQCLNLAGGFFTRPNIARVAVGWVEFFTRPNIAARNSSKVLGLAKGPDPTYELLRE
jgi:hypothetical protein